MGEGRDEIHWQHAEAAETALGEARATAFTEDACHMGRIMQTGAWMSVLPSTVNGTELGAQEWRYSLFLRYGINPPDFPNHCDGCDVAFDTCYTLNCKKGGLVTARHNELRDGFANLARKSVTPMHVRDYPKIYTGHAMHGGKSKLKGSPSKDKVGVKGGLFIRDLWTQNTDSIHDMRVLNTDSTSYRSQKPEKCLETTEKEKNNKYLYAFLRQRWRLTPFFASVEGLLRFKEEVTLKRITRRLATKWKEPYSRSCGYVNSKVVITFIWAN